MPITLKNIVLATDIGMRSDLFNDISGITIYVQANEKDVKWDDNFSEVIDGEKVVWHNCNKVVYGDKWITAEFYDAEGNYLDDSDDKFVDDLNFDLHYYFEAGETYYIKLYAYESVDCRTLSLHVVLSIPKYCSVGISTAMVWQIGSSQPLMIFKRMQ